MPDLDLEARRFDVWHEVPLVPQLTGMSCWAAAAAMIVGWRECIDVRPDEVAAGLGRWDAYRRGLEPGDVDELARVFHLLIEPPRTYSVDQLRGLLERFGPLWVGEATPGLHVVVVAGLHGDGTPDATWVRIADPWPIGVGERYSISFRELASNLAAASDVVGATAQVLHSDGQRGRATTRSEIRSRIHVHTSSPREISMSGQNQLRSARIVVDPGHGGQRDLGLSTALGVRGVHGTLEKDVTLRLARRVANRLGGRALLTRDRDDNLPIGERIERARRAGADVFVSLHANGGPAGARGAEAWVHERAGAGSFALAESVQRHLARWGNARVARGPMAVLAPDRLGRAAACLVEVEHLGDPAGELRLSSPLELERIAASVAGGVRAHLSGGAGYGRGPAGALDWFEDTDQLDAYTRNPRAADTRAVSTVSDALGVIAGFRASSGGSAWRTLDRGEVAWRLEQLVQDHRLFQQGNLNLCGPASFFTCWTKRDPVAFARFATALYESGQAQIGSFNVAPSSSLTQQDYAAMRARMSTITEQADWMVMGALRNNDDAIFVWEGDPGQELAGITFPEEVERWMNATGLYSSVDNRIGSTLSALFSKGYNAAADLQVQEGTDTICLIQANMVASQIGAGVTEGFLSHFSNHYVVLNAPIVTNIQSGQVMFNIWTFAADKETLVANTSIFADNYYGAIVARMR
ncbi:MAG TPA: papain-like cysteine protease family protein [Kofleriaceae bacterium]|nr:papain-like cysteine protease family protein [Kofleriaceae bacterium]